MELTQAQKNTFKAHKLANTNTVQAVTVAQPSTPQTVAVNLVADLGDNYLRIAEWYNAAVTGAESQPFTPANELWVRDVQIQQLNAAIDWSTQVPHGLGGSPTVSEQFLARVYKILVWQSATWNSRIDLTDPQQRAAVFNTWGTSPNATTDAIAAVGVGRKVPTRAERLFAGALVGQAGIGGAIGRVCPIAIYGQTLGEGDVRGAILNGA